MSHRWNIDILLSVDETCQFWVDYYENKRIHNHLQKHQLQIRKMVIEVRHWYAVTIADCCNCKHEEIHGLEIWLIQVVWYITPYFPNSLLLYVFNEIYVQIFHFFDFFKLLLIYFELVLHDLKMMKLLLVWNEHPPARDEVKDHIHS